MATCGSLHHIFETLLPEKPNLFESLSWNQIKPKDQTPSFTEIFGELHFKESNISSTSPPQFSTSSSSAEIHPTNNTNRHKSSDSFSSLSSKSLHVCTEGLGFESSGDVEVEELKGGENEKCETYKEKECFKRHVTSRVSQYPPPISCIGRTGKPWVCFRSYRTDGRFVLKEIRIPTHEFLHACREDGRLKLHYIHPDDELTEEEEEEEEEEEGDDDLEIIDEEDEEEEIIGEENDDCVVDHVNEEKEAVAQVSSHSLEIAENLNA